MIASGDAMMKILKRTSQRVQDMPDKGLGRKWLGTLQGISVEKILEATEIAIFHVEAHAHWIMLGDESIYIADDIRVSKNLEDQDFPLQDPMLAATGYFLVGVALAGCAILDHKHSAVECAFFAVTGI